MKMQFVEMCNQKAQERKAIEYSRSVQKRKIKKVILGLLTGSFLIGSIAITSEMDFQTVQAQSKMKEIVTEDHIICDVVSYAYNNDFKGNTDLYCEMPNGEIHIFTVTDAPARKVKVAALKIGKLNDYTTYEVVAMR